jgi:endonuclease/exonuclease/phosphatase family metal-dependent hydrolase
MESNWIRRRLVRALLLAASTAVAACHPLPAMSVAKPGVRLCPDLGNTSITWHQPDKDGVELERWCAQTGSPVIVKSPPVGEGAVQRLLIIDWNVHVGGGRVSELVDLLRQEASRSGESLGVVVLLQETYRRGGDIKPPQPGGGAPGAIRPQPRTGDIEAIARELGMSAFYVPSMRNGEDTDPQLFEDRGNAILSTEPFDELQAIELPFGAQRRVAVQATVHPRGHRSLRVLAAHLDTARDKEAQRRQAEGLAAYLKGLARDLPIVMGADTNAILGIADKTVGLIDKQLPHVTSCGIAPTSDVFRLDFLFSSLPQKETAACQTRFQEYGSDHKPLALLLDMASW